MNQRVKAAIRKKLTYLNLIHRTIVLVWNVKPTNEIKFRKGSKINTFYIRSRNKPELVSFQRGNAELIVCHLKIL